MKKGYSIMHKTFDLGDKLRDTISSEEIYCNVDRFLELANDYIDTFIKEREDGPDPDLSMLPLTKEFILGIKEWDYVLTYDNNNEAIVIVCYDIHEN
jgi:hypothetical protein